MVQAYYLSQATLQDKCMSVSICSIPGNGTIGLEGTSRVCSFTQMSSGFQKDSTAPAISGNACFSVLARPEDRVVQTGHECQE